MLRQDPANGVDAIVSGQALPFEPGHRSDDGVQPFRNLVLGDRMEGCVCLEIWQLESLGSVRDLDQTDPLLFFKRQPLLRIWRLSWVVAVHGASLTDGYRLISRAAEGSPMEGNVRAHLHSGIGCNDALLYKGWPGRPLFNLTRQCGALRKRSTCSSRFSRAPRLPQAQITNETFD